jgi:serine/threonine protein kinase
LGEGGFAQVFAVTIKKSSNEKKLALKRLRPELLKDKQQFQFAADALVQESRIMALLKGHDHILTLRGVSCEAEHPLFTKRGFDSFFLVTDALRETMTDRVLQWNESPSNQERWMHQLQYALQVAKALAYCHEHRIVYRDCKVDNLGFTDEHTVALFDFGLARELPEEDDFDDAQTCTSSLDETCGEEVFHMTICGSQRHMAAEVFNRGWYNCKADTYSWAMTVVEMITGKKPYPYMSLPVHKILVLEGGGRPNVEGFPTGLQHILKQSWAHSVSERWSMAQVCAALETYIGSECSQQAATTATDSKTTIALLQDQAKTNNLEAVQQQQQPQPEDSNLVVAGAA